MSRASVTGKLVLKGKIILNTPLIIGSGDNELSDLEVLKDESGMPFIPATSFTGVLRHCLAEYKLVTDQTQSDYFWGSKAGDGCQSALCCHDLRSDRGVIKIRDGVAIDYKRGLAIKERKYDYEVVEPGISFPLYLEVTLREAFNKETFKKILKKIVDLLKNEMVSFGAKTTAGFGRCKLVDEKFYEFDFSVKEDVLLWLKREMKKETVLDAVPFKIQEKTISIEALFSIKNSLIVRSYSSDPDSPDAVHIQSNGKYVLPGTSTKGALRARALKILNTLEVSAAENEKKINSLFGFVDETKKEKQKSRVIIEETEIKNIVAELQHRIKIDRFTGGVIKGALFDTMPLWGSGDNAMVTLKMTIYNYTEWEAGLLLLILKDLWNGDLPIGGEKAVGRGVLKGIIANIIWKGNKLTIEEKDGQLVFSDTNLAGIVNNFCKEIVHA